MDILFYFTATLAVAASIADIETTVHGLSLRLKPNTVVLESNTAVYGVHPSRLRLYAIGAPIAAAVSGLAVLLDKFQPYTGGTLYYFLLSDFEVMRHSRTIV